MDGANGAEGPPGDSAQPNDSVEDCVACHGAGAVVPVHDITDPSDPHYVDTDPDGPLTPSGYRELIAAITSVDVTANRVIIAFGVLDDQSSPVTNLFAEDGRFSIAALVAGSNGDADDWASFITTSSGGGTSGSSERFTTIGGTFTNNADGTYVYASAYDPSLDVASGDSVRVAVQLSATDIPPENAWCDFDADTAAANTSCATASTTLTRDIVQTATCNTCHGATSETQLAFHGGGRTDVEYCVTCHNPTTVNAEGVSTADMKVLIHTIHMGADLATGDSLVSFTKDIDDCTVCHTGAGVDVDRWSEIPTRAACGSCHDDVDFDTGANHPAGAFPDNRICASCHPKTGVHDNTQAPVETVHYGVARNTEAARYRTTLSGMAIESLDFDYDARALTVEYSVSRDGARMNLASDPEWLGAGVLTIKIAWTTRDYRNDGSGRTPAQPISIGALPSGGSATEIGSTRVYTLTQVLPASASGTATVTLEGRSSASIEPGSSFDDRIAVRSVFDSIDIEGGRAARVNRRAIVDGDRCNACHDAAGAGISLHGNNRTGDPGVCVVCHNPDATDINQRPSDAASAIDGKREESIDMKRMIHQIHAGGSLERGIVIYGFGGSAHDFGSVDFIGNLRNCESCHLPGTYGTEEAGRTTPTTLDTGDDSASSADDSKISPTASVCESCHDNEPARTHMKLNGASFRALEADIR